MRVRVEVCIRIPEYYNLVTHVHCLYCRYEKRHTNVPVHVSPCFRVADGDTVIFGQCRCVFGPGYSAMPSDCPALST